MPKTRRHHRKTKRRSTRRHRGGGNGNNASWNPNEKTSNGKHFFKNIPESSPHYYSLFGTPNMNRLDKWYSKRRNLQRTGKIPLSLA